MNEKINKRVLVIVFISLLSFAVFTGMLINIQMVNPQNFFTDSAVSSFNISVSAPRGEILD